MDHSKTNFWFTVASMEGMAAVLYGEGAMSITYILLEYVAGVLQASTIDYGVISFTISLNISLISFGN